MRLKKNSPRRASEAPVLAEESIVDPKQLKPSGREMRVRAEKFRCDGWWRTCAIEGFLSVQDVKISIPHSSVFASNLDRAF